MAFSQHIEEAQTPAVCHFCEESSDLRWKCINCDVSMCQICTRKVHDKLLSSDQHEIINLKDYKNEDYAKSVRKVDLKNMPCTTHSDQMCCAFCTDCDKPVCMDCLIESHKNHDFKKLEEVYNTIISEIKDLQNKLESCLQVFSSENERLKKLLLDGDKNFQEIKDKILQTEKEIMETISKYTKEILQELESIWKPTEDKIKAEHSVIQMNKEDLITRKERLNKTLMSHQAGDIFSERLVLDQKIPDKLVETINCDISKTKFIIGNRLKNQNTRKTMFGNLYVVPDLQVVQSYQSEFGNVLDILNCDGNIGFITCFKTQKLQKIKFEGKKIIVVEEYGIAVQNIAKLTNDKFLLSTGKSELQVYSTEKQFKPFKSFSPLKAISVHVSQNNKIFVGLTECHPVTYSPTKEIVRRVVVLDQEGEIQHSYQYDNDNQRLFTRPKRINTLYDNIFVIDTLNYNKEGRVMRLDHGGQLLSIYNGCHVNSDTAKFYPSDITVTSSDIILVSDQTNHAIHILNFLGEIIECKCLKKLGIESPLSLNIDEDDILWIGCNKQTTEKNVKAKIFAVKLT